MYLLLYKVSIIIFHKEKVLYKRQRVYISTLIHYEMILKN